MSQICIYCQEAHACYALFYQIEGCKVVKQLFKFVYINLIRLTAALESLVASTVDYALPTFRYCLYLEVTQPVS